MDIIIKYFLISVIIIILIFRYILYKKENFDVFAYNVFSLPKDPVKNFYQKETEYLDVLFDQINKSSLPDFKQKFQKYPDNFIFPLTKIFQKKIINTLTSLFDTSDEYKKSKLSIVKDIYNIYWVNKENSREFVFTIDLNNSTKQSTRPLYIYLILRNVNNYLKDDGNYITPNESISNDIIKDIDIQYIGTKLSIVSLEIPGLTENINNNYYRIQNKLRLMDPYLTSGKDMIIDDEMKKNFDLILEKNKTYGIKTKEGFCYNTTNVTAKNKEECISSSGIWDYPPNNDNECPYYKANENYPNNYGGLIGNQCQLPQNMQIIGNRHFSLDTQYSPLCYNCKSNLIGKGTLGYCCDQQTTPDYAFVGDSEIREKYSDILKEKNLNIH